MRYDRARRSLDRHATYFVSTLDAADADDRSVSAWIRRALDHELEQASKPT